MSQVDGNKFEKQAKLDTQSTGNKQSSCYQQYNRNGS